MQAGIRSIVTACTVAAAFCAASAGAQTFLGPTPYTSQADSPFAAQIAAGTVVLETFEDGLLNVPNVTASIGAPFRSTIATDSVDADDGTIDGSGARGVSFLWGGGRVGITFTFNPAAPGGLPTHAGIVWTDGAGNTRFLAFGPGGELLGTIGPVAIADDKFGGETGEDRFFGVINAAGISSIWISNDSAGIEVDHLQFGVAAAPPAASPNVAIPLLGPLGLALMVAALAITGIAEVRRR